MKVYVFFLYEGLKTEEVGRRVEVGRRGGNKSGERKENREDRI